MSKPALKLISTKCPICQNHNNYSVLYPQNFSTLDINATIFSARRLPDKIHFRIVKCRTCGLVRSNPMIDAQTLSQLYAKSQFTYKAETDNLIRTYLNAIQPILLKLNRQSKILEIGCGNGFLISKLYRLGYHQVYGLDPSHNAVINADPSVKSKITCGLFKPGLYPQAFFECLFIFQTLDHISDPNSFLDLCHHLLKPGGYILTFNHNIDSLSSKILKEKSPIIDIEHPYLYSGEIISKLFKLHKFTLLKLTYPSNYLSLKYLVWLTPMPHQIKRPLLSLKSPWLRLNIKMPLGNLCLIAQK